MNPIATPISYIFIGLIVSRISTWIVRIIDLRIEIFGFRIHHWMIGILIIILLPILFDIYVWENILYTLYSSGIQLFLDDIRDFIRFLKNIYRKIVSSFTRLLNSMI